MATKEASQSPDSYIGSFISLISKSEIRYEGVLYDINAHESSIGLKNVRSFGSEGRKQDGPQVGPSDKVYDYICFRGTDIKDLQVLSSLSVQSMPAIPDDPAIIQSHYLHPVESPNLRHSSNSSMTSFNSDSQLGCPSSAFQSSLPQYQPVGHMVSCGPSTPLNEKSNESNMPMYWQGLNGHSGGYSYLESPPLLRPSPLLLASSRMQQMPHSTNNPPITSDTLNFSEISLPLLSPSSMSSLNSSLLPPSSASSVNSILLPSSSSSHANSSPLSSSSTSFQNTTMLPLSGVSCLNSMLLPPSSASSMNSTFMPISSSALSSGLHIGHAASSVSNEASSFSSYCLPNAPSLTLSSSLPFVTALTSGVDTNNVILQFSEKSKLTVSSTSTYPNTSAPTAFIVGTSSSNHCEVPSPSLVMPGQLLQSVPTSLTVLGKYLPLQTAQKDIEVVQTSTLANLSRDAIEAQASVLHTASVSSGKMNEAYVDSQYHDKGIEQGRGNGPYGATVHTHQSTGGHVEERDKKSNGVTIKPQNANKVHVRGRINGLIGTAPHSYPGYRSHTWGMEKMKGTAPRDYHGRQVRARGRINTISHSVTKFSDDFDFEAMNEKFKKDELWGELGKSVKNISKDNGDVDDSQEVDAQREREHEQLKVDIKPVYVKEEFFDSLNIKTFDRDLKKGRSKFSEHKKLDAETFGVSGRGSWGGRHVGSRHRRGYGRGGRGPGRSVWSRVT